MSKDHTAKVVARDDMRPRQVFAINISIMHGPYAVPLPVQSGPITSI
jgi:hypothetical protein